MSGAHETVTAPVEGLTTALAPVGAPGGCMTQSGKTPRHVPSTWHTMGLLPLGAASA